MKFAGLAIALAACATGDSATDEVAGQALGNGNGVIAKNTPGFIKNAKDLGPVDPSTVIEVTAWLDLHNEAQLDQLVKQQQTKGHANYHKWLKQDDFNAQFGPTANELKSVQNWLNAHNLTTVAVAENNFYVKVQGSVGDVQKAFHVQLDNFNVNGKTVRSNTGDPSVNDSSGSHIAAVTGLDDFGFQPMNVRAIAPDGQAVKPRPVAVAPNGLFFEGACFRGVETHTFTSPDATYTGNRYGADITNGALGHLPSCGYQPSEVRAAYGLNNVALDGTGETIVIVDAFGSPTIEFDAWAFSIIYGLPPVDLTIVKAPGIVHNPHGAGWDGETTLDVEWAHAMAPGAKIALVVATAHNSLDEAINYAVVHHLGNTISNSWSSLEGFGNPAQMNRVERILQMAAVQGIDVNFSSGDSGDEEANVGFKTVDYPGSSVYATSIGGTSLALSTDSTVQFETGWGTNITRIVDIDANHHQVPLDPPFNFGFQFGAGGGTSLTFDKPAFQAAVPGAKRRVPDVGMLADPYTGVEIIQTDVTTGDLQVGVIGGTSLACPLFSGVMALAAQKAGHGLGQAAPLLYGLPAGAVRDIKGPNPANNVTGTVNGTAYSADELAGPLDAPGTTYFSAFYNTASTRFYVLTFNTDSSLAATDGWDNVTGVGAPNGQAFLDAIAP
jgi:subtilase family serine protease